PVAEEHEPNVQLLRKLAEPAPLRTVSGDREQEVRTVDGGDRANEDVHPLLRGKPTDGEDDDVLRGRSQRFAELVTTAGELVGARREMLDVDRVRKRANPL